MKKSIMKSFIFVILNLLSVLVLLSSLVIYTSLFKIMPWYEPCGMQFYLIFMPFDPAFLIIGISLFILGRFFHMSTLNKWLPFMAIIGLSLPIMFGIKIISILIGTSICIVLCVLTIVTTIRSLGLARRRGKEMGVRSSQKSENNWKVLSPIILFLVVMIFAHSGYFYVISKKPPPKPPEPGVLAGAKLISKSIFVESKQLGRVYDIARGELDSEPGAEIGIAWAGFHENGGAAFCNEKGEIKSTVVFDQKASNPKIVDVEKDGICEFLSRGGDSGNVMLFNHRGETIWFYKKGKKFVNHTAAGDIDGDGELEFALSFNAGGGVRLLESNGELIWKSDDSNAWHIEMADTNQDGNLEIISSNSRGSIKIRDKEGNILSDVRPKIYFNKFTISRWPSPADREYIITSRKDEKVYILDFNGKTIAKYNAPKTLTTLNICAAPVLLIKDKPHYFAVLIMLRASWHRSILYLYDDKGNIAYQEVIPDICRAMCIIDVAI